MILFYFLVNSIAKPEDDEIAEKEIFMAVEKEMELPAEQKSTEESSEKEQTKDKFQRLNLFFERETVIIIYQLYIAVMFT